MTDADPHPLPAAAGVEADRLAEIGKAYLARISANPQPLTVIELPEGLGVCVCHAVRGGGKIYVAPDGSVLFVGSARDFGKGLDEFRTGARTAPENFGSKR